MFRRRFITRNLAGQGLLYLSVLLLMAAVVLWLTTGDLWLGVLPCLIWVLVWAKVISNALRIAKRSKQLSRIASQHPEYVMFTDANEKAEWFRVKLGAIDELHNVRDPQITNVVSSPDWTYGDFRYSIYGQTKNGEYERTHVYYGVMTTLLPRRLPHIFFDSIKARRRQFRFHFNDSQRHSLEGDFDNYFVTYFPEDYTIDSLSFISPDVMLALRDAHDYDIEIFGDRLFLYGPLYDPQAQLADMSAKIGAIKKELVGNVLSYRDERLPFSLGRKDVAIQGASLKVSRFWEIFGLVASVIYILVWLYIEITAR